MEKYDFNTEFIDLDDVAKGTLSKQLRFFLGMLPEGKTIKLFGWYNEMKASGVLALDESDRKDLYDLIDTSKLPIVLKGQLLKVLNKVSTH